MTRESDVTQHRQRIPRSGLVFGSLSALPLVETMVYNAHVAPGSVRLSIEEYFQLGAVAVLLIAMHTLCFLIPQGSFKEVLQRFKDKLEKSKHTLRENLVYILLALPALFLIILFGGASASRILLQSGILGTVILPILLLGFVAGLIWAISRILRALSIQSPSLRGAINEWAFSVRLSIPFYVLLVAATLRLVNLDGIRPTARIEFSLGIAKDYLLIFIIAGILFTGLFKIGSVRSLKALFQSKRGFLHFILICGVIAILAIWADFNSINPTRQELIFNYEWQKQLNRLHVYVRDIGLLLMPIAGLLFWSLSRVSEEIERERGVAS